MAPFSENIKQAFELYKGKLKVLAVIYAFPFVANFVLALIGSRAGDTANPTFEGLSPKFYQAGGLAIVVGIVAIALSLMATVAALRAVDSTEQPDPMKLISGSWSLVAPLLLVSILVGLAIIGGLILLIVPGIIFGLWFSLSAQTLVFENKRGTDALKASKAYVQGRTGYVFVNFLLFVLVLIGIGIVSGILAAIFSNQLGDLVSTAISAFVTSPLSLIFTYVLYKRLKQTPPPTVTPAAAPPAQS
jgi:hypothetical protein